MSLTVTASEHGVVRIIALGYRVSMELQHFEAVDKLAAALGVDALNPDDVQLVDLSAVREMGFTTFLSEGYGISLEELTPLTQTLNALSGHVAILRSGAFQGAEVTLENSQDVRLVATLHEPRMSAPKPMPTYDSATGTSEGPKKRKQPSDAAMSGRVATYVLLFIFAFTALFVWIAS